MDPSTQDSQTTQSEKGNQGGWIYENKVREAVLAQAGPTVP